MLKINFYNKKNKLIIRKIYFWFAMTFFKNKFRQKGPIFKK